MITDLLTYLKFYVEREKGQTMAEYAVVLAVITLGIVLALSTLAGGITGALGKVTGDL